MSIHTLRKRFVKDAGLPIQVMQSPYFEYFLELYDPIHQCKSAYDAFILEVELVGGEEPYLKYAHELIAKIAEHIRQKESYKAFNDSKDQLEQYNSSLKAGKENIYNSDNNGKRFLSIDLKKANFNALRYHNDDIVDGKKNYEEWICQFTPYKTTQTSKHVRQVIFGNLNPSRQIKVQKFIIAQVVEMIVSYFGEDALRKMKSASSDEVVIEISEHDHEDDIEKFLKEQTANKNLQVNIEVFTLKSLHSLGISGYVKEYKNGKVDFKTVPDIFMAQAYKIYFEQPLQEEDFVFYHESKLAKFI